MMRSSKRNGNGNATLPLSRSSSSDIIMNSKRHSSSSVSSYHDKRNTGIATLLFLALSAGCFCMLLFRGERATTDISAAAAVHRRAVEQTTSVDTIADIAAWDLVVVGAGPAGLTAALFGARAGLTVLVVGSRTGQLSETAQLDNFPSFVVGGGGQEWLHATRQQAATAGAHFAVAGLLVERIAVAEPEKGGRFSLQLSNHEVPARSVIVATGATARRLHLPREDALWGRQVHSCAICDASAYRNRRVVVVGGGDAAIDAAILLARHAQSVTLVHRRDAFRASNQRNLQLLVQQQQQQQQQHELSRIVSIQTPYAVREYVVDAATQKLTGVVLQHATDRDEPAQTIPCDGVFVLIGSTPNTEFLQQTQGLELDRETGLVVLPPSSETSTATTVPGIFAAGEVTDRTYQQAITAAAAGAQAAIDAERWLRQSPQFHVTKSKAIPNTVPLETIPKAVRTTNEQQEKRSLNNNKIQEATMDCDLTTPECITATVNKYPVVVFSKPWCPYCKKALEALSLQGVSKEPFLKVINLLGDGMKATTAQQIQATLGRLTGGRVTVPNVFVGGTSIGGGDETYALHRSGQLRALLQAAGAYGVAEVQCDLVQPECITETVQRVRVGVIDLLLFIILLLLQYELFVSPLYISSPIHYCYNAAVPGGGVFQELLSLLPKSRRAAGQHAKRRRAARH